MAAGIHVFWEDRRKPGTRFGPNLLLCACLADERADLGSAWDVDRRRVQAHPCGGRDEVIRRVSVAPVDPSACLVVLDRDEAWRIAGEKDSSDAEVIAGARERGVPAGVPVALLDRNVESLVDAARRCLGESGESVKDRVERDRWCARAAAASRGVRDCVRAAVPSFDALVRAVLAALG